MFCTNCGSNIPDNSAFCPACGMKQAQQQARPQERPQQGQARPQQQSAQPRSQQMQYHEQQRPQPRQPEPKDQTPYIKIMVIAIVCIFAALLFVLGFMFVYNKFIKNDEDQSYETQISDTQVSDDISTDDNSDKAEDTFTEEVTEEENKDDKSDAKEELKDAYDLTENKKLDFYGDIKKDTEGNYLLQFFDKRSFVEDDKVVKETSYMMLDLTEWDYDMDDYGEIKDVEVKGAGYIAGDEAYIKVSKIYDEEGNDITKEKKSEGDGDYIIPDSDSKALTLDDIKDLSIKEINYAKNEIYARHGRKFKSKELSDYFNSKSWYKGTIDPADFNESSLSSIESQNVKLLSDREFSLDPNGYKLDQ